MKGLGLAAVRERIRKSFLEVHNDCRDKMQRQADEEMIAAINVGAVEDAKLEEAELLATLGERSISSAENRAHAYIQSALRLPHVHGHRPLRRDLHGCYVIEAPTESASELFAQAMRQLGNE